MTVAECETFIGDDLYKHPELTNGNEINFDLRPKRQRTDETYNSVVLVTDNDDFQHVAGINRDGIVKYPFPWVMNGEEIELGPWDCDVGTPLTTTECCAFIQASVPGVDDNGRHLECYVQTPEASDPNTVIVVYDPVSNTIVADAIPKIM